MVAVFISANAQGSPPKNVARASFQQPHVANVARGSIQPTWRLTRRLLPSLSTGAPVLLQHGWGVADLHVKALQNEKINVIVIHYSN